MFDLSQTINLTNLILIILNFSFGSLFILITRTSCKSYKINGRSNSLNCYTLTSIASDMFGVLFIYSFSNKKHSEKNARIKYFTFFLYLKKYQNGITVHMDTFLHVETYLLKTARTNPL